MGTTPSPMPLGVGVFGDREVPASPQHPAIRPRAPRTALFAASATASQDDDAGAVQQVQQVQQVQSALSQATPVGRWTVGGEATPTQNAPASQRASLRGTPRGRRQPLALWAGSNPQTPAAKPPIEQFPPPSTEKSSGARADVCAICLSPVKLSARSASREIPPDRLPFRTSCCQQLFHKGCLKKCKARCKSGSCPLCRSETATGLTPAPPPRSTPPTVGRNGAGQTGFVGASTLHQAMLRRVATARAAVQRSLVQSSLVRGEDGRDGVDGAREGNSARPTPTQSSPTTSPTLQALESSFQEALSLRGTNNQGSGHPTEV